MNPRRLYRSRDRQLAGVAGGMGEYLNIDPTVIRILWILTAIVSGGLAIIAYIVLAIVVPESPWMATGSAPGAYPGYAQPGYGPGGTTGFAQAGPAGYAQTGTTEYAQAGSSTGTGTAGWTTPPPSPAWSPDWAARAAEAQAAQKARGRGIGAAAIVGVVLIVIGAIALADAALPGWSSAVVLGPAVILALGVAVLVASIRRQDEPVATPATPATPASETGGSAVPSAPTAPATSAAPATEPGAGYQGSDTQPVDPTALA